MFLDLRTDEISQTIPAYQMRTTFHLRNVFLGYVVQTYTASENALYVLVWFHLGPTGLDVLAVQDAV